MPSHSSSGEHDDSRRTPRPGGWLAVAAALAVTTVSLAPASAAAGGACGITQVTSTTQIGPFEFGNQLGRESLSGDGTRLVFASESDLTGDNPDGQPQVFYFDRLTGETRQVSSTPAAAPVISADGSRVAFTTWDGLDSGEIFVYEPASQETTQLTSGELSREVMSISADGTRIVYVSDDLFRPFPIEVLDTTSSSSIEVAVAGLYIDQETTVLSPDGTHVVFASRADITGHNPDGSNEVFLFDAGTEHLTQITPTVDQGRNTGRIQFTDHGGTIVFSTNAPVAGPHPGAQFRDYRYDIATGVTTRVPDLPVVGRAGWNMWSPNGRRVAGATAQDPTGGNPERNIELYSYAPGSGRITQLTSSASHLGGAPSSVSTDGSTIAFVGTADLTGDNPDHNPELYLATTCDPAPRPDTKIAANPSGPYTGRNLYAINPTAGQKLTQPIAPGASRRFHVRIHNQRATTDSFTISGRLAGAPGYQVTYLAGRDDITDQVLDGTYTVGPLGPGEFVTVKVKIRAVTAGPGTSHVADLTARSQTNPVAGDTVRAKVTRN